MSHAFDTASPDIFKSRPRIWYFPGGLYNLNCQVERLTTAQKTATDTLYHTIVISEYLSCIRIFLNRPTGLSILAGQSESMIKLTSGERQ